MIITTYSTVRLRKTRRPSSSTSRFNQCVIVNYRDVVFARGGKEAERRGLLFKATEEVEVLGTGLGLHYRIRVTQVT